MNFKSDAIANLIFSENNLRMQKYKITKMIKNVRKKMIS